METAGERFTFQCPLNFEPAAKLDGTVTSDPDTEVWLIKAPADFTPESFTSHRISLSSNKTLKVTSDGIKRRFQVSASPCDEPLPCRAFLPQPGASQVKLTCAPAIQGIITVAETYKEPPALHPIPDRPPLTIPDGLQHRFQPFGAIPPKRVPDPLDSTPKIKKKSKKRKRQETVTDETK
ncbi:DNA-directed RNA polymerase I subunit RPA34 isoform X2 [Bombina bombina]|uniref:DNA-directed RNA polymerase I subunit RPA34 isoform X2 n=1 Tax=Bombina bombina TaxID=8345 RepID=UPI00235AC03A|nr:DNA-directed RNA polymerase I subunit RPA34 isoform X2 [Bombina bombina]XP_053544754.1 DNA-directed RNA polymerase I subunit RPA34 isoform X2 [Bombina bombina]XP_053544755.1 DNA-directed RNA polymerase I subunit RPA34 isoform X2 [Bombina bombina]XP_053544756.1 DNA-directed RNA polymerase I subunit RPA34 isoform X2 [Bombina bombina]XP_053544757.1 DNA-directed RNA polymerase I subunit RPA34 isoform X2 [Bombina bombina]XP_053544758.1 DNA-directed RNA polymerase I subunit RPA34 isoform X2 [Bomb